MGFSVGQYDVSGHAFDRFSQRFGLIPQELPEFLQIARKPKKKEMSSQLLRAKAKARSQGKHLLISGDVVFLVDDTTNVVVTVFRRGS